MWHDFLIVYESMNLGIKLMLESSLHCFLFLRGEGRDRGRGREIYPFVSFRTLATVTKLSWVTVDRWE